MKHVIPYRTVSESIGRGSVILIRGKGSPAKLYATHVTGFAMLKSGVKMLFLSDEFYRIKKQDGRLIPVRINLGGDASLMGALNLKSQGKLGIVTNHNKTPFHWKTLNHTSIYSALREVEEGILLDDLLLEKDMSGLTRDDVWNLLGNYIGKKTYRTIFEGTDEVDVFRYHANLNLSKFVETIDETTSEEIDWGFEIDAFDRSSEIEAYLNYFETLDQPIQCSFTVSSDVDLTVTYTPGSHEEPSYSQVKVNGVYHLKIQFEIEGTAIDPDPEFKSMLDSLLTFIREKKIDDDGLHQIVSKKIKTPRYLKGE